MKRNVWIRFFSLATAVQIKAAEAVLLQAAITPLGALAMNYGGVCLRMVYTVHTVLMSLHAQLSDPYTITGGFRYVRSQASRDIASSALSTGSSSAGLGDAEGRRPRTIMNAAYPSPTTHSALEFDPLALHF